MATANSSFETGATSFSQTDWEIVTATTKTAVANGNYIANNAALVTVTLPATATPGARVQVAGWGAGGWRISQGAGQYIKFGSSVTTTGTGGYIASTVAMDTIDLICVVEDDGWLVVGSVGNVDMEVD